MRRLTYLATRDELTGHLNRNALREELSGAIESAKAENRNCAFLVASILFIQVPGPSLLFTLGRALTVGRRDALLSVVGNALGLTVQVVGVAVGLGAIVAASAEAFTVLKLAGAAYVVNPGGVAVPGGGGTGWSTRLAVAE